MWIPRRIEIAIEAIASHLGEIEKSLQEDKSAIDTANISETNEWSSIRRQVAEMRSDDEYKRGANTYKHKSYIQQVVLNWLTGFLMAATIAAFAAALIYACIANHQTKLMREANERAKTAMEIDERAWVTFSGMRQSLAAKGESAGSEMRNTGKTPARHLVLTIDTMIHQGTINLSSNEADLMNKVLSESPAWNNSNPPRIDYQLTDDPHLADLSKQSPTTPLPPPQQRLIYIFAPNLAPHEVVGRSLIAPTKWEYGVLGPNQTYPLQAVSASRSLGLVGGNDTRAIVIFGKIEYTDIFAHDETRITRFCSFRQSGVSVFSPCPVFNDAE